MHYSLSLLWIIILYDRVHFLSRYVTLHILLSTIKLSYTNAFTKLIFIHTTVIINNDRVEDCQSQLKMFIIHTLWLQHVSAGIGHHQVI